jgi:uncharacterized membrane protein YdjX (TVP38/TMEM64 family)
VSTPPSDSNARPPASAASNAASIAWLAALGLLVVRVSKPTILEKMHLDDKPVWWFVVLAAAVSFVWGAIEWATLRPLLVRSWGVAKEMGFASVLGVLASTLPLLGSIALYAYIKPVAEWLRTHPEGIWIYLAGFVLLGGVALLPTYAQAALGGFAFGAAMGIPLALGGFAGAAVLGYFIAMAASPERVRKVVDRDVRAAAVRRALAGGGFLRQTGMVTLLRLPPTSPFALTNLVLAAAGVKLAPFVIGTLIGMAPRTIVAVVIGAGIKELTKDTLDSATPKWVWWAGIGVSVAVLAVIMLAAKKALAGVLREHGAAPSGVPSGR